MYTIDLNCDCGESFGGWTMGDDAAILSLVSSANIACGAHAGDPQTMRQTLRLARQHGLGAGAHPGYPDLQGFGRRVMALSPQEIENTVLAQIGALAALARAEGMSLAHVKPHGALANQSAVVPALAEAIARAVAAFEPTLVLVALAGSALEQAGQAAGLVIAREAYADRTYQADGTLRPRSYPDALITDPERCLEQALEIIHNRRVIAVDGSAVAVEAETICLHGDLAGAVERARVLRAGLERAGVQVRPMAVQKRDTESY